MSKLSYVMVVVMVFLAGVVLAQQEQGKEPRRDAKFVEKAAMGGMFEVEAGKAAARNGQSDAIRRFGQRMVADHGKPNAEQLRIAQAKSLTTPQKLDAKHAKMLDKLTKAQPAEFDKIYADEMIKAHKEDVKLYQTEAEKGQDAELKAFAAKTLPVLQDHLTMIQGIAGKPPTAK
jgi:putative membrane protein